MHGLDVNFDMENDFYAVNGFANYYAEHPIDIKVGEKVRIYLSNMTEFDLVNNFHLHANMFDYYPNGTSLTAGRTHRHGQPLPGPARHPGVQLPAIPGMYMFHAHTSEFAELGWMGFFNVKGVARHGCHDAPSEFEAFKPLVIAQRDGAAVARWRA